MPRTKAKLIELCRRDRLLNSAAQYAYLNVIRPPAWWERGADGREPVRYPADGPVLPVKAAFICDEMTWIDLAPQCRSIFLMPGSWREQMERFQPDLFFCESAWSGIPPAEGCWRGRIYRNRSVLFENRRILLEILRYCRERGIPTVFWNKEDPPENLDSRYDFIDTAVRFDHVFTSAEECVEIYQALGCGHVGVLPFMVNTAVYYPAPGPAREGDRVLFAGSWFGDQDARCQATRALFDYVLGKGMGLDIYDRHSESVEERFSFPEEYAPYLHPSVPTDRVPALMRRYGMALNVNTETASRTMFSRRALYLAACGLTVLSNPSAGMRAALGGEPVDLPGGGQALLIRPDPALVREKYSAAGAFRRILDAVPGLAAAEPVGAAGG